MQSDGPRSNPAAQHAESLERQLAAALDEVRRATAEQQRRALMVKGLSAALREQADAHLETLDRLQRREEEALRRSEERFQRLLESAGEGIYGIDDVACISFVNPAAARMLAADRAALLDRPLRQVLRHEHDEGALCGAADCPMEAPLQTGTGGSGEAILHACDGRRVPVEYTSTPVHTGGTTAGAVIVLRDVTERRRIEEQRARLLRDLQASLTARDDFLSIASHELRTPLTPLRFQLHMLKRGLDQGHVFDGDELARRIDGLERQIQRLDRLIEQLLDVSRITVGRLELHPERVDLSALTREVIHRMQPEFAGSDTVVSLDAPVATVGWWDPLRLEQVVTNLVSNAVKYGAGRPVDVAVTGASGRAVLTVRDHGIGVAPEDRERIFERFERPASVRHYGGFGLGLWIVRKILEAHEGTIEVDSEPGRGATFTVRLPMTGTSEAATRNGSRSDGERP